MYKKNWIYKDINEEIVSELINKFNVQKVTAIVLQNRLKIIGNDINNIGKPSMNALYSPFLLKDMGKAILRIKTAIANNEKVVIYGDYDADGVTSTSILYLCLKDKIKDISFYIPDRVDEGYGMNPAAIDKLKQEGVNLIITVDTGVTAVSDVKYATDIGIDVIVTDHHECKDDIPDCCAVIDPKQSDCQYPFKELAGVGVVFKLITALEGEENIVEIIEKYMSLVALGTIADVVPLTDENRTFVKLGLKGFQKPNNCGISALLDATKLTGKKVTAGNIGFIIAPRINAAGRLGSAYKSVELFICNNQKKATEIANILNEENIKRQTMEQHIFNEAIEIIESNRLQDNKVIIVAKKGWHHGVIGIVSSKITDKYYKPSILISIDDDGSARGSGRSIAGFNLFEALASNSEYLTKFGGHSLAAGLSMDASNIKIFDEKVNEYASKTISPENLVPPLYIDTKLSHDDLKVNTAKNLSKLEPYGMSNPTPVFSVCNAKIRLLTTICEGKHLKLIVVKDKIELEVIGFNYGHLISQLKIGEMVDVAGTLNVNHYMNQEILQLFLKDIRHNS